MNADRDPFAVAGQQENQDAEILALFHEWLNVCRTQDANRDYEGDDDKKARWEAACDHQADIEDRIFACCGGAVRGCGYRKAGGAQRNPLCAPREWRITLFPARREFLLPRLASC